MLNTASKALLAAAMLAMPVCVAADSSLAGRLDELAREGMSRTQTQGLAVAVIDDGKDRLPLIP